jgi:hypothetical protein
MNKYWVALGAGLALSVLSGGAQTAIASGRGGLQPPGTGVMPRPVTGTPHFSTAKGTPFEQVRQLVHCDGKIYAVGRFSQILQGSHVFERHNAFSFRATPPFTMTSWDPNVNGTVNSIAFRRGKCSHAYIGGSFTSVNGTHVKNIAAVSTWTGGVVKTFAHDASDTVETIRALSHHVLVGGYYTSINGSSANPYMTSLDPRTGKDDGFVRLKISGNYQYPGVSGNPTRVYNQALSHNSWLDLVMGDFTSVGGQKRQQIFMLRVGGSKAKVTHWTSPLFNRHCITHEPFYIRAASWSPDDAKIYIATTGRSLLRRHRGSYPLTGLCDVAAAFPATKTSVKPIWINYTGCDSLYSTAADASTAYFGGHPRWSMNSNGCDHRGPGSYSAKGLQGLSPTTGALYLNSSQRNPAGYYERSRGVGADDMLLTQAGLWIASDNFGNSESCDYVSGLSGICFLPYASSASGGSRR